MPWWASHAIASSPWRVIPSTAFRVVSMASSASSKAEASMPKAIVLGLDLQGGSQLLLEVDQNELIASQAKGLRDDVRRILQQEGVRADGGIGDFGAGCVRIILRPFGRFGERC